MKILINLKGIDVIVPEKPKEPLIDRIVLWAQVGLIWFAMLLFFGSVNAEGLDPAPIRPPIEATRTTATQSPSQYANRHNNSYTITKKTISRDTYNNSQELARSEHRRAK